MHRPTSDIDLLGFVDPDEAALRLVIRSVCTQEVEEDGVSFDPESVRVESIREESVYGGLRCLVEATLGSARLRVQLDIGFGDAVTPEPQLVELPRLLEDEVRRELRAYTAETVVAEKFEAIVRLGLANSRMKDYLDIDLLLQTGQVDHRRLAEALRRTFRRRMTPLPRALPIGLTEGFWHDEIAQQRWRAFVHRNRLSVGSLEEICMRIGQQVAPILVRTADHEAPP